MLNPIPLPYRILGFIVGAVIFGGVCYWRGGVPARSELATFRAQVAATAQAQARNAKQQEIENDKQTKALAQSYADDVTHLRTQLDRMRKLYGDGGGMPATPGNTQGIDGSGLKPGRACESSGLDPCEVSRDFYEGALDDALHVHGFQEWVIRQRIPVR